MDVLIKFIVIIISQGISISSDHVVLPKYTQLVFVDYASVKAERNKQVGGGPESCFTLDCWGILQWHLLPLDQKVSFKYWGGSSLSNVQGASGDSNLYPSLSSKALGPPFLRAEDLEWGWVGLGSAWGLMGGGDLKGSVESAEVPTAAVYVRAPPGG